MFYNSCMPFFNIFPMMNMPFYHPFSMCNCPFSMPSLFTFNNAFNCFDTFMYSTPQPLFPVIPNFTFSFPQNNIFDNFNFKMPAINFNSPIYNTNYQNFLSNQNYLFIQSNTNNTSDGADRSSKSVTSPETAQQTANMPKTPKKHNGNLVGVYEWDNYMKGRINNHKKCNDDYIAELQPPVQEKVRQLEAYAKSQNIPFRITSGYRTASKQKELRNRYGSRRAAGINSSPHRFGRAIDINADGVLTEAQTTKLGIYAESIGMRWGGRWGGPGSKTERERWHFDLPA